MQSSGTQLPNRPLWLIGFGVLVALAILLGSELFVRLCFPWVNIQGTDHRLFVDPAATSGRLWAPGSQGLSDGAHVKIDDLGCRNVAGPSDYDDAWLILGDSVAFGVGVESGETFADLLQSETPDSRVLNSAVIGNFAVSFPDTARRFFKRVPQISRVTLVYCLNDIPFEKTTDGDAKGVESLLVKVNKKMRTRSKLYRFVAGWAGHGTRQYFFHDLARYRDIDRRADEVFAPLNEVASLTERFGAEFEIVVMPYRHQLTQDTAELWRPQEALGGYLDSKGISWRDARGWFIDPQVNPERYYLWGDPLHFNSRGHQVIFDHLRDPLL